MMALLSRRKRPPVEVTQLLDGDERVVSFADTVDGAVVVATSRGLWWPFPSGPRRLGWHLIDKAVWRDGVLSVTEAEVVDELLLVEREPACAGAGGPS